MLLFQVQIIAFCILRPIAKAKLPGCDDLCIVASDSGDLWIVNQAAQAKDLKAMELFGLNTAGWAENSLHSSSLSIAKYEKYVQTHVRQVAYLRYCSERYQPVCESN
jgi:hypothetical protein